MTNSIEDIYQEVYHQECRDKNREERLVWLETKETQAEEEVKSLTLTIQKVREVSDSTKGVMAREKLNQYLKDLNNELAIAYDELSEIQQGITFVTESG